MPQITLVVHTQNDALRLGRCLETVYPCDEILVVDHGSSDETLLVARDYGARIVRTGAVATFSYSELGSTRWILCLDPCESLTEALSASLYEWKIGTVTEAACSFAAMLRQETANGWVERRAPQTRLVPVDWRHWNERMPANDPGSVVLQGEILRFELP